MKGAFCPYVVPVFCQEASGCHNCNLYLRIINGEAKMTTDLKDRPLKCTHCGHEGEDVVQETRYIGGQGYVTLLYCKDRVACWNRFDEQNLDKHLKELKGESC